MKTAITMATRRRVGAAGANGVGTASWAYATGTGDSVSSQEWVRSPHGSIHSAKGRGSPPLRGGRQARKGQPLFADSRRRASTRTILLACLGAVVVFVLVGIAFFPSDEEAAAASAPSAAAPTPQVDEQARRDMARRKLAEERRARRGEISAEREAARTADPPATHNFPIETGPLASGQLRPLLLAGTPHSGAEMLRVGLTKSAHIMPLQRAGHDASGADVLGRTWVASALASENKRAELRNQYYSKLPRPDDRRLTTKRGATRLLPALAVDATPSLLIFPNAPENVVTVFGDEAQAVRMVAVLRNPIERAAAHYAKMRTLGASMRPSQERSVYNVRSRSFSEVIKSEVGELTRCRERYAESLTGWWYECFTNDVRRGSKLAQNGLLWNSLYGEMLRNWYCEVLIGGGPGCFQWDDERHLAALSQHRQNWLMVVDFEVVAEHPYEVSQRVLTFAGLPTSISKLEVEAAAEVALRDVAPLNDPEYPSDDEIQKARRAASTILAEDRAHLEGLLDLDWHLWE